MMLHGSCVSRDGDAVLILGPPGAGKSDLALRLLDRPGWALVADDQVEVAMAGDGGLRAKAPPALSGMLEVRGVGLLAGLPAVAAPLRLAIRLVPREAVPRLPEPRRLALAGGALPELLLHGAEGSAALKVEWALAAATGAARLAAGAFA